MSDLRDDLQRLLPDPLSSCLPEAEALAAWVRSVPEDLLEALANLEPRSLEKAARALTRLGADATAALTTAEERSRSKETRKALRRALHTLRSRGVSVEAPRGEGRGRLPPLEQEQAEAFVGPISSEGHRILILLLTRGPGARLFQVQTSDEEGVLRAEVFEGRRGAGRAAVRDLRTRSQGALVAASPGAVRELLRRLLPLKPGAEPSREQMRAREMLEAELSSQTNETTPGEEVRERLVGRPMAAALATKELMSRLRKGEVAPWLLRGEEIREGVSTLQAAEQSLLVLSETQTRERRARVLEAVADRALDATARARLTVRLEETAYHLAARDDEEGARAALAVADEVQAAERPTQVEFLRLLIELSLEAAGRQAREEQRGRLILPR